MTWCCSKATGFCLKSNINSKVHICFVNMRSRVSSLTISVKVLEKRYPMDSLCYGMLDAVSTNVYYRSHSWAVFAGHVFSISSSPLPIMAFSQKSLSLGLTENIVVSSNATDPCQKAPTQKFLWDFWTKNVSKVHFSWPKTCQGSIFLDQKHVDCPFFLIYPIYSFILKTIVLNVII